MMDILITAVISCYLITSSGGTFFDDFFGCLPGGSDVLPNPPANIPDKSIGCVSLNPVPPALPDKLPYTNEPGCDVNPIPISFDPTSVIDFPIKDIPTCEAKGKSPSYVDFINQRCEEGKSTEPGWSFTGAMGSCTDAAKKMMDVGSWFGRSVFTPPALCEDPFKF